ncbi:MAG: Na(+)/H(+) antiporter NhaA [Zetaproteobacteria bacterium CG2_30_46_52]|nr:MAG: Na(+)/H(+) antiporter NhaA [Zetaproteobacteria bacterium CG2_30_46_52]
MVVSKPTFISDFFKSESAAGILLMGTALLAIIIANSPLSTYYALLLDTPVEVRIGALHIAKPLLLWINDGLMAVFFFLVGLELKRELIEGELADKRNIILPAVGALGGMVVPALIYLYFNQNDPTAIQGWAIPAATDIAFALGILFLLGSRVPTSIKIFLTSLAIFDDIGAIIIIAIFYTADISAVSLIVITISIVVLFLINRFGVTSKSVYIMLGVVLWVATLKSGVHATLAGVVLAIFIPIKASNEQPSMLKVMEHDLHSWVTFFVLPVFAFANAGLNLAGVGVEELLHPVPLGIALGLFIGKQLGVFAFCWLVIQLGWTALPKGMSWLSLYGTAALCGVGFTMSLFIGSLAFEETGMNLLFDERLGIILGSIVSGVVGYLVLRFSLKPKV